MTGFEIDTGTYGTLIFGVDIWMIIKLIFLLLQERKGEVRQLKHMPGGILCSVHSCCNIVAAG